MSLIDCDECGKKVSDKASQCPNCGAPITLINDDVMIRFPLLTKIQIATQPCYVYDKNTGNIIATCRQGETATFKCDKPMNIYVSIKGSFGKPEATVNPGERYDVSYMGFGKIYMTKVDTISGKSEIS